MLLKKPALRMVQFEGETGKLAQNIMENWLIGLRETNPAILDMFHERDLLPYRDLLPWSGEFAGKYITGAYYIYQMTREERLYRYILGFIDELLTCQDEDGYLGCYQKACRLTGALSQNPQVMGASWDAWSHYHLMVGLLLWYGETGREAYLEAVKRIAALFMRLFYDGKRTLASIGSTEMNLSVYHAFALLANLTGDSLYLLFARKIEEDLKDEEAGNYIEHALAGREYYQCPRPRWESMHVIMGIAEMYRATGDQRYLQAASQITYSILRTDIHNTGAFSTDEQAVGNPYTNGAIETCCVVAFNALAYEVLKLTGDPALLDFLEISHYNAVLGYYSPTGRWSTYNTPMAGTKMANYHQIVFQSRPGSPDLNCCSVNAPRGVALIGEWALLEDEETLYINDFETLSAETAGGVSVQITGEYPCSGNVAIRLHSHGVPKKLGFRIPAWSKQTTVQLGADLFRPEPGRYFNLERVWDDTLHIAFDFTPRLLKGEMEYAGQSSVYVGPILYAWDRAANAALPFDELPPLSFSEILAAAPERLSDGRILLRLAGGPILTDFYHTGQSGCEYKTWLPVRE